MNEDKTIAEARQILGLDKVIDPEFISAKVNQVYTLLPNISIGIIGVGATGGFAALGLSKTLGKYAGNITCYDPDTVSLSNVDNQIYGAIHIEMPKCTALSQIITGLGHGFLPVCINSRITENSFLPFDIILLAIDDREMRIKIIDSILKFSNRVKFVVTGGISNIIPNRIELSAEAFLISRFALPNFLDNLKNDKNANIQYETTSCTTPGAVSIAMSLAGTYIKLVMQAYAFTTNQIDNLSHFTHQKIN